MNKRIRKKMAKKAEARRFARMMATEFAKCIWEALNRESLTRQIMRPTYLGPPK